MAAKVTLSVIKADVGSICGHSMPHPKMVEAERQVLLNGLKQGTVADFHISRCGDDSALIMTHTRGENSKEVHGLAWEAFTSASKVAKELKVYAAGQDLLVDAFSGNIRGMGPGAAEMEFEERPAESVLVFMADKCAPAAYSLAFARTFLDPFTNTGLVIDPRGHAGYEFDIADVVDRKHVVLKAPEETYDILALIGDTTRFSIKRVHSRHLKTIAAVVSTEKLSLIAGKYVGKDDPVAVMRVQAGLPAVGEALAPFTFPALVAGWSRGSHHGPLYPCAVDDSSPSYMDGPPRICCLGFQVSHGKIRGAEGPEAPAGHHEPLDYFRGSEWDLIRTRAMEAATYIRGHGPIMPGIVPPDELEYTTRPEILSKLAGRFQPLD